MSIYTTAITLILVMDPLGNIPVFISVLNPVEPNRRWRIILRESVFAFLVLAAFLFSGKHALQSLGITQPALAIAGGIILFLIALPMIFPRMAQQERQTGEPFFVPLAVPLVAGPSAIATVMLFATQHPERIFESFLSLFIASAVVTITLLFCNPLRKVLGPKGLVALERLMGMILITVSVQMFLSGISNYFHLSH
jgi:multiple antibiotic resistance protein